MTLDVIAAAMQLIEFLDRSLAVLMFLGVLGAAMTLVGLARIAWFRVSDEYRRIPALVDTALDQPTAPGGDR